MNNTKEEVGTSKSEITFNLSEETLLFLLRCAVDSADFNERERLERIAEIVRAFYKYQPIVSFVDIGTRKLAEATIVINEIAKLCL